MATQVIGWASDDEDSPRAQADKQLGSLTVLGHSPALTHPLFNGANLIGRRVDAQDSARECPDVGADSWEEIFLEDLSVSARHAVIYIEGDGEDMFVKDLKSTNRTCVQRKGKFKPLTSDRYALESGAVVRFGAVECRVSLQPSVSEAAEDSSEEKGLRQHSPDVPATQLWNVNGADPQDSRAVEQQRMPSASSPPSALQVNAFPAPYLLRSQPGQAAQPMPDAQETGKENTPLSHRTDLRKAVRPNPQSPFSEAGAEEEVPNRSQHGWSIPIPSPSLDVEQNSRMASHNPQGSRGHLSLQDWAAQGQQASSSLQSLQSLGDSLPSLGDWGTFHAAAGFRDLSRDSVESGFGSTGSSPIGSSPPRPGQTGKLRCRSGAGLSNPSQHRADADADFSFSFKQPGADPLHGIAEEGATSDDSADSNGAVLLRSLQHVSAMSDDQDGASSLLLLQQQATHEATPPRPCSPGIKRSRTFGTDDSSRCKSPRRQRDV